MIKNIAIVGGTHGNEYTGPFLIKRLCEQNIAANYSTFNSQFLLSNPKAYKNNLRFVDIDLNRSFLNKDLNNALLGDYEANRAKVVNQLLGPKEAAKTDFIIDIHTTTANMGISIILVDKNEFNLKLARHLKSKIDNIFIYYMSPDAYGEKMDQSFLVSIAKYGFALELGAIPNSIIRHDILKQAEDTILASLAYIENMNQGGENINQGGENMNQGGENNELEVFEHLKMVEFPLDKQGNIEAVIHENIQDRDYLPLQKGEPIFEKLNGDIIYHQESETLYPVFINEAAYYYKKIAFSLTRKIILKIPRTA